MKATTPKEAEKAVVFHKDDIIANSRQLFNKPPEVVAGALYDVKGAITIEQATEQIASYLARPISTEGGN